MNDEKMAKLKKIGFSETEIKELEMQLKALANKTHQVYNKTIFLCQGSKTFCDDYIARHKLSGIAHMESV